MKFHSYFIDFDGTVITCPNRRDYKWLKEFFIDFHIYTTKYEEYMSTEILYRWYLIDELDYRLMIRIRHNDKKELGDISIISVNGRELSSFSTDISSDISQYVSILLEREK